MSRQTKNRLFLSAVSLLFVLLLMEDAAMAGPKRDREQERLLGPVKTVLIEIAKISEQSGKQVEHSRIPWTSTTYDPQGNRVEERQLYDDESLNFKSVFTYDPSGMIKEGVEYDYQGTVTFKWDYSHDRDKKTMEEARYEPGGALFSKSSYQYDADGNLVEEMRLHSQSANDFKWVYLYDEAGRKVEESFYVIRAQGLLNKTESTLDFKSVYAYDAKGNLIEETRYDGSGGVKSKKSYRYEFDAAGNWIVQTSGAWVTRSGKPYFEPTEATYRTITYHPRP
jgi:hypothetical protein